MRQTSQDQPSVLPILSVHSRVLQLLQILHRQLRRLQGARRRQPSISLLHLLPLYPTTTISSSATTSSSAITTTTSPSISLSTSITITGFIDSSSRATQSKAHHGSGSILGFQSSTNSTGSASCSTLSDVSSSPANPSDLNSVNLRSEGIAIGAVVVG